MKELLISMINEQRKMYEEKLIELKLIKEELRKDIRERDKLEKLVAKSNIQGVELTMPEVETQDIEEIEESIKIINSLLRRFDTIYKMYDLEVVDGE